MREAHKDSIHHNNRKSRVTVEGFGPGYIIARRMVAANSFVTALLHLPRRRHI
jgi:hypothetical protein